MFEHVIRELLGPHVSLTIEPPQEFVNEDTGEVLDGNPRLVIRPGLTIELAPEQLIVDGDSDDPVVAPLIGFGVRLRRIFNLVGRFPWNLDLGDRSVTANVEPPA